MRTETPRCWKWCTRLVERISFKKQTPDRLTRINKATSPQFWCCNDCSFRSRKERWMKWEKQSSRSKRPRRSKSPARRTGIETNFWRWKSRRPQRRIEQSLAERTGEISNQTEEIPRKQEGTKLTACSNKSMPLEVEAKLRVIFGRKYSLSLQTVWKIMFNGWIARYFLYFTIISNRVQKGTLHLESSNFFFFDTHLLSSPFIQHTKLESNMWPKWRGRGLKESRHSGIKKYFCKR